MPESTVDIRDLLAAVQATNAKLDVVVASVDEAKADAREARDTARETAVVIREQNALARVAEVRAEARQQVENLRSDFVHAQTNLKKDINGVSERAAAETAALEKRVDALEDLRSEGAGLARGGKVALELMKLAMSAGVGALVLKLFGG